jgi:hypothetical protein
LDSSCGQTLNRERCWLDQHVDSDSVISPMEAVMAKKAKKAKKAKTRKKK